MASQFSPLFLTAPENERIDSKLICFNRDRKFVQFSSHLKDADNIRAGFGSGGRKKKHINIKSRVIICFGRRTRADVGGGGF